jgi:type IV pilus assembly protein PilF
MISFHIFGLNKLLKNIYNSRIYLYKLIKKNKESDIDGLKVLTKLSYLDSLQLMNLKFCFLTKLLILALVLSSCGSFVNKHSKAMVDAAKYHYDLAYGSYIESQNGEVALQEILLSLQAVEDDPQTHFLAALIFSGRNRTLDAIKHYKRAIELNKDFYEAQNNLGTMYLTLEQWDLAIPLFESLSQNVLYPSPGLSHNNLGWAYYKKKEYAKAKQHLLSAIQLSPSLCPPHNNMGLTLIELGELESAVRYLKQAIDRCPKYAEPYHHIGQIFLKLKQYDLSKKAFLKCSSLAVESPLGVKCDKKLSLLSNGYEDEPTE